MQLCRRMTLFLKNASLHKRWSVLISPGPELGWGVCANTGSESSFIENVGILFNMHFYSFLFKSYGNPMSVLMVDYFWSECSLHSSHPSPGVILSWFSRRLAAIGQSGNLNKHMFIVLNIATLLWVWMFSQSLAKKKKKSLEFKVKSFQVTKPCPGTSLEVQGLRFGTPNEESPGSVHGQVIRSHMPQLRVLMP